VILMVLFVDREMVSQVSHCREIWTVV